MTVKDVILAAAEGIGIQEKVKAFAESGSSEGKKETEILVQCFNRVENEVALDFLPLYVEDETECVGGKVSYASLSKKAVRILQVTQNGERIKFRLFPDYLEIAASGFVKVFYSYAPEKKKLNDESDFKTLVSDRTFADGVAAEYCLATGLFEEAQIWDKKYKDSLCAAYKPKASKVASVRRWV